MKDENQTDKIMKILDDLHQYVPSSEEVPVEQVTTENEKNTTAFFLPETGSMLNKLEVHAVNVKIRKCKANSKVLCQWLKIGMLANVV